jgi:Ion transport protein
VLFNGMEKTSHWAALYFVALMTFGNYVLFNLLVAILVEGFSAEVKHRRIRPSPQQYIIYSAALVFSLDTISRNILFTAISLNFYTCTGFILLHNPHPLYI